MRVIDFFDKGAALGREAICVSGPDATLAYGEVERLTHRIANALHNAGIRPGDKVAVYAPNSVIGYVAILGLLRAEATWVAVNVRHSVTENLRHMRVAGCRAVFIDGAEREAAQHLLSEFKELDLLIAIREPIDGVASLDDFLVGATDKPVLRTDLSDDAPYRISTTGGTTGIPKAVIQTHRSVATNTVSFLATFRFEMRPRYLLITPMTHAAGVLSFPMLALGGTIYTMATVDPCAILEEMAEKRITTALITPTVLYRMLSHERLTALSFPDLRQLVVAAAPLSEDRLREALTVLGPVVYQCYGQTEASMLIALMSGEDYMEALTNPALEHRLRSCGREGIMTQVRIMGPDGQILGTDEIGEIVVRGDIVMAGYLNDPDATSETREHGWHHTGDVGRIDPDGFVYVVDRKRDLIITGGFNVFPGEVEQVIFQHPAVQDCAVVGVPDDDWGEAVIAVIELKDGQVADAVDIIALCKSKLGSVKAPKSVEFWATLPRSPIGKVLRREVRSTFWADRGRKL